MSEPRSILLTGSTGFVGAFVLMSLRRSDRYSASVAVRNGPSLCSPDVYVLGDFDANTDWHSALAGVDVVIHCAARAHVLKDSTEDPLAAFRTVNRDACLNLAKQAADQGVKRFIFLSSIGVSGNHTDGQPFRDDDYAAPAEPYAISKFEAEQGLWAIQRQTGLEVVIIRPPLVYGPNPPGNFGLLMDLVRKGIPLPLAAVNNRRSFVSVWNLVDLIVTCIDHPKAKNRVFLVSDGEDLSTTDLISRLASSMGKRSRLFPFPAQLLRLVAAGLGKRSMAERLLGSLEIDVSQTCRVLNWTPPYSVDESLKRCFEQSGD